ncbi:MAG: hypothetical protein AXW12_14790 [Thalassospira sp. Nap_22]|nr:MAG: hypothetical protein AXW12_14790 [Thalassospira sp. Nap_22]
MVRFAGGRGGSELGFYTSIPAQKFVTKKNRRLMEGVFGLQVQPNLQRQQSTLLKDRHLF